MKKTFSNRIKNVMMKMMITCEQASFLIDKEQYTPLSLKEKINLNMHLLTCKFCRLYKVESHLINNEIKRVITFNELEVKLSDEQKQRIIDKLKMDN